MSIKEKIFGIMYFSVLIAVILFSTYMIFIRDYFEEISNDDYIHANKYYSIHVATKDLYCEYLEDHFLSEHEYYKLFDLKHAYDDSVDNAEAKNAADSIKAKGCSK